MKTVWTKLAEDDLEEIIDYIYENNPQIATKLYKEIKSKVLYLEEFPKQGKIVPELKEFNIVICRELIIKSWRIIYKIGKHNIYIISVIDARRNFEDLLLEILLRSN